MMGIRHRATAFYFDRVVVGVGRTIDAEIDKATENCKTSTAAAGKAQLVLNRWFRTEGRARYKSI
jgi:hypothetical protein